VAGSGTSGSPHVRDHLPFEGEWAAVGAVERMWRPGRTGAAARTASSQAIQWSTAQPIARHGRTRRPERWPQSRATRAVRTTHWRPVDDPALKHGLRYRNSPLWRRLPGQPAQVTGRKLTCERLAPDPGIERLLETQVSGDSLTDRWKADSCLSGCFSRPPDVVGRWERPVI
jgi:hypothetical protein